MEAFVRGGGCRAWLLPASTHGHGDRRQGPPPAPGHYIDDFIAALLADDSTAAADLWEFLVEVLRFKLQPAKFNHGTALLYLGMELRFSHDGILFVISENRRRKYVALLQRYLDRDELLRPQAAQLAGRLNWACNALFGRCGRAFLSPILARAAHREARPALNRDLRGALQWWQRWLSAPRGDLSRFVPSAPRRVAVPAVSYSDASTDFGLGGVLLLPTTREGFWFRTRVPAAGGAEPIDRLEVEAAAVVDALFGPLLAERGYIDEVSFVDNNASLAWVCKGRARTKDGRPRLDVDPMLSGMWLQMAIRGGFKWFERVSSASNLADRPSRGLAPECPCGYRLREVVNVRRWGAPDGTGPGRPWVAF